MRADLLFLEELGCHRVESLWRPEVETWAWEVSGRKGFASTVLIRNILTQEIREISTHEIEVLDGCWYRVKSRWYAGLEDDGLGRL